MDDGVPIEFVDLQYARGVTIGLHRRGNDHVLCVLAAEVASHQTLAVEERWVQDASPAASAKPSPDHTPQLMREART
jgi:hypothetical protein